MLNVGHDREGDVKFCPLALALLVTAVAACTSGSSTSGCSSIWQVDFDNFTYGWDANEPAGIPTTWEWLDSKPDQEFRTINGEYKLCEPNEYPYAGECPLVSVDSVTYGDLDGDGVAEAVVALTYHTGGTAGWQYLYVYKMENDHVKLLARMRTGSRADGGLVRVFVRNNLLVADFSDAERRIGDCCSEGYIRVHYRLRSGGFVEALPRERGDLDLNGGPPRADFNALRVREIYNGRPASAIITKDYRNFRTMIRRGANRAVDFAGHYTVPRWGCGTSCNAFVIVDSIGGKVYSGESIDELPFQWVDKHGGEAIERMEFYPNSRLMQINACPNEKDCGLYEYEMIDGKGLKLLRVQLLPKEFQPPEIP